MRMSQSDPGYLKVMVVYMLAAVVMPQIALTVVTPSAAVTEQLYELIAGGIDLDMVLQLLPISPLQWFLQQALSVVLQLYQFVMVFGLTRYCLSLYRGEPCGPADLFVGFSTVGRVLAEPILVGLIILACTVAALIVLVTVGTVFAMMLPMEMVPVLLILFWIAFCVGLVCLLLNYVLSTLTLADRPELGAMGAIQYSKNLIRGHKKQYFILWLSFLGWSLLCSLPMSLFMSFEAVQTMELITGTSAGMGLGFELPAWAGSLITLVLSLPVYLWLTPYMNTTMAGFYDSLHSQGFQPPVLDDTTAWHQ